MADPHVIVSRLSALDGYRAKLESFLQYSREDFLADEDVHQLAERNLHLACECMLDLAQHIVSDQGFRQPKDYKDMMAVLHEEGVLDHELAEELKGWMGFRNVLVHLYLEIDHGVDSHAIPAGLSQIRPRSFSGLGVRFPQCSVIG